MYVSMYIYAQAFVRWVMVHASVMYVYCTCVHRVTGEKMKKLGLWELDLLPVPNRQGTS